MISLQFSQTDIHELQRLLHQHEHGHVHTKALALLLKAHNIVHRVIEEIVGCCGNTLRAYFREYENSIAKVRFYKPENALSSFKKRIEQYIEKTPPATIKQACAEIEKLTGTLLRESQMRAY